MDWLWLALLGFGTGAYGVLVGAGGGFILGPALLIFSDMDARVVAGTSLALVAVNSMSGAFVYRRLGLVDYRSGLLFAAAAIPGSVAAPLVLTTVAGNTFRLLFGLLLLALAAQMVVSPRLPTSAAGGSGQTNGVLIGRRQIVTECRPSAIMGHVRGVENPRV